MRRIFLYGAVLVLTACGTADQKAPAERKPSVALSKSAKSDAFNLSFARLLADYYALKDNFIAEKDTSINTAARNMMVSADSLALTEMKADSNLIATAQTYSLGISSELKGLLGETTLDGKRRSFQMIGDQLYDLIRTVQFDRAVIYHMYCPTAFNDQGATWLNYSPEIRNPYIPKKMIDCGSVRDSIDFRPKK